MLKKVGVQSQYSGECASPTKKTLEIVEMVACGSINKQMVSYINEAGGKAIGLCGKDGNMVVARKLTRTGCRSGFRHRESDRSRIVQWPDKVDTTVLDQALGRGRFQCWRRCARLPTAALTM